MAQPNSVKAFLGRALRETGAALKEAGNAEVRKCSPYKHYHYLLYNNNIHHLYPYRSLLDTDIRCDFKGWNPSRQTTHSGHPLLL
jgi:hypothetical protein